MSFFETVFGGHLALALLAGLLWIAGGVVFFRDAVNKKPNNEISAPLNKWCTYVASVFLIGAAFGTLFAKDGLLFRQSKLTFSAVRVLHHFSEKIAYGAGTLALLIHHTSRVKIFSNEALHGILALALYAGIMVTGSHANPMGHSDRYAIPEMALHMHSVYPTVFVALMSALQAITKEKNPYRFLQAIGAQVAGVWYLVMGFMMGLDSWHTCYGWENSENPDSTYYNPNCKEDKQEVHAGLVPPLFGIIVGVVLYINLGVMARFGLSLRQDRYAVVNDDVGDSEMTEKLIGSCM